MTTLSSPLPELLEATDEQIAAAVEYADPVVLRSLLYQLTGDEEIANVAVKNARGRMMQSVAIASEDGAALLRRKAAEFLRAHRDAGAPSIDIGPKERLPVSANLMAGGQADLDMQDYLIEELALDPWARSLQWKRPPDPARLEGFSVTVIGAALAGLNAAVLLKRAGITYTQIEKNSDLGGTWYENRYPGARLDTPSRGYFHLFGADYPFDYPFNPWTDNYRYFQWAAEEFNLRDDIQFNTEAVSLKWDDRTSMWEIELDGPDGRRTIRSNVVITAVGFLNRPKIPELDGAPNFAGRSWHTARWPEDVDITGKRVAVIGSGCTGYQMTPEIALKAEHVFMFQRTPSWMWPVPRYTKPFPPEVKWLDRNLPCHANFARMRTNCATGWHVSTDRDPDFTDPFSVSQVNKDMRDESVAFLENKLGDPDLVAKMTPPCPPWSQRPVIVDPEYCVLDAIMGDKVTLVTDPILRATEIGIETETGDRYDVDFIVYATGFRATDYLFPMTITGRNGTLMTDVWAQDGPRSYRYSMVPGFPNLWMLYGPNTNGGIGPGPFGELVTLYALQCIEHLVLEDKQSIEVKEDAYWHFGRELDGRNNQKVWSDPRSQTSHSYFVATARGRSTTQNPFSPVEVYRLLRQPNFDDLVSS